MVLGDSRKGGQKESTASLYSERLIISTQKASFSGAMLEVVALVLCSSKTICRIELQNEIHKSMWITTTL